MKKIEITENGIQILIQKQINFCNKQQHGSDFDLDRARTRCQEYAVNLIKESSSYLIEVLTERMEKCMSNLEKNLDNIEYADNCGHIVWKDDEGKSGQFNVPNYEAMELAIKALKEGNYKTFLSNRIYIDQTLKALLIQVPHFIKRYDELVSLLCEAHTVPTI